MRDQYPEENGKITINGHRMDWTLRRSKSESAFGMRGSRIFEMEIKRDGTVSAKYSKGWDKRIDKDDEETSLCAEFLVGRFGKERPKKRSENE